MLLKNHLIEVFKKASSENNILLKENIVLKWVHRFGIDSLNDLLIHSSLQKENQREEENQEQITLMDEVDEEENQEQIKLKLPKTFENINEKKSESNSLETSSNNDCFIHFGLWMAQLIWFRNCIYNTYFISSFCDINKFMFSVCFAGTY